MNEENKIKIKLVTLILLIVIILIFAIIYFVFSIIQIREEQEKENQLSGESVKITKIIPGTNHIIIQDMEGRVWAIGDNTYGELGIGNTETQQKLVQIGKTDTGKEILFPRKIIAGNNITIIEDQDGEVWVAGDNTYGQLGIVNTQKQLIFTKIGKTQTGTTIKSPKKIECGENFIVIEDSNGQIWVSGENKYGQLGIGNKKNQSTLVKISKTQTEKEIRSPNKIIAGGNFLLIEDSEGIVWGCGDNTYNQIIDKSEDYTKLYEIKTIGKYPKTISAGLEHTIVELSNGKLIGAGRNIYGSLTGKEEKTIKYGMKKGTGEEIINPQKIICKGYTTIIQDSNGEVWVCGWNYGQFGNSTERYSKDSNIYIYDLILLRDLSNKKFYEIKNIHAGGKYLIIEDHTQILWCSGNNESGQLGTNTMEEEPIIGSFVMFCMDRSGLYE